MCSLQALPLALSSCSKQMAETFAVGPLHLATWDWDQVSCFVESGWDPEVLLRGFSFHLWMDAGLRWLGVRDLLEAFWQPLHQFPHQFPANSRYRDNDCPRNLVLWPHEES